MSESIESRLFLRVSYLKEMNPILIKTFCCYHSLYAVNSSCSKNQIIPPVCRELLESKFVKVQYIVIGYAVYSP